MKEGRNLKWIVKDVEQFEQAREYVDTGVIPLLSISAAKEMKMVVEQGEFIELLSMELEREYKGRVLLLPAFTYLVESQKNEKGRLQEWTNHLRSEGFKHIAYVTSDFSWKEEIQELQGDLFWFPSLALEQFSDQAKREVIHAHIKNIMVMLEEKWGKQ
ncbi:MAG: YpiF family protein [Bacillus cereus]|jgi:Zn-dependent M16 (insulinase) family peptidase|uniref:YpiF family protein n=1 Tax=Bacillus cereus TaxID=1396 RepID=UPI00115696FA|nr:YpiF family protein [Bacillus cereus]MDR2994954.1 YpiF family protein [Bacillus cereus]